MPSTESKFGEFARRASPIPRYDRGDLARAPPTAAKRSTSPRRRSRQAARPRRPARPRPMYGRVSTTRRPPVGGLLDGSCRRKRSRGLRRSSLNLLGTGRRRPLAAALQGFSRVWIRSGSTPCGLDRLELLERLAAARAVAERPARRRAEDVLQPRVGRAAVRAAEDGGLQLHERRRGRRARGRRCEAGRAQLLAARRA